MRDKGFTTAAPTHLLRRYAQAVLRYPLTLVIALAGIIVMQVGNVIAPLYLREFFNTLAHGTQSGESVSGLLAILGTLALWWFVAWVGSRIEHFSNLRIISNVMADLVQSTFGYLIGHSHNFFISNFAGSLTHKVNKYARSFQILYEGILITFLPTLLFVLGAIVVLFTRSHTLGTALAVWVVLFVLFQVWVSSMRQPLRKARSEADTRITASLADAIGNQSTILLFSAATHEQRLFTKVVEVWRRAGIRSWNADATIWAGVGFFMLLIQVVLLYLAIQLWQQGNIFVGDFVLIQAYLLTLFERLVAIQQELRRVYDAFADGGEMVDILERPHGVIDKRGAKDLAIPQGEVWFDNVNFWFNKQRPVLRDFNLRLTGGERVALVGPSGAGKSTITRLLLRMYDLPEGEIKIDKQNIAEVTQESLRNSIAFVPQEPVLFHRSLMENIRYGRRDATDPEVLEAAKQAHCHEFIQNLSQGYHTYVGERGVKLSGGERQRVAIARAILKNAPILVLDEATSSLDSESETLIQDALEVLMRGKTVIVIAHRLSTIMKMDKIVVVKRGSIVAQGTHLELIRERGLYQKLWSIQAGGFIGGEATESEDVAVEDIAAAAEEPIDFQSRDPRLAEAPEDK